MQPHQEIQANRPTRVQFTSDPNILFALDHSVADDGTEGVRIVRSTNGGSTWSRLADDPVFDEAYWMWSDPTRTGRLLVSNYSDLYRSDNGGQTWTNPYETTDTGTGLHIGGIAQSGDSLWIGTTDGVIFSGDGGATFALMSTPGLPTNQKIVQFAGANTPLGMRFLCLLSEQAWAGIDVEEWFYVNQQCWGLEPGAGTWVARNNGLPNSGYGLSCLVMSASNGSIAYASGQMDNEYPFVYRTADGGATWNQVLFAQGNQNVRTGWAGQGGDRGWTYGAGTTGLGISPVDANRVGFSDYGFLHLTDDGGTNWRQAYVHPDDENPAGSNTPPRQYYRSAGLEDTSCWDVGFFNADIAFCGYGDIRGTRTNDGGASWGFDYSGTSIGNQTSKIVIHPTTGRGYIATSTVHDLYQSTYLTDARLQGDGAVLYTENNGSTWSQLHDFDQPVIYLALDPNNAERMYASVVLEGIYVTNNLSAGASSTWTLMATPPGTEGRPYTIHVLNDGTLVCTYGARRTTNFQSTSGVFVWPAGGSGWEARRTSTMQYWVKDLMVWPHDASQNTWYVGVWSGWGGPSDNNTGGGLYRTTNRGLNWTRIWESHRVTGAWAPPDNPNELYVTTEVEGLWYTDNAQDATPTFTQVAAFPFRQPERVVFNPFDANEMFVTTFGGGLWRAQRGTPNSASGWLTY